MPLIQVPEINLRVMSLNMQYGAGPECKEQQFLVHIPKKELNHNLDSIVDLIVDVNPDIVCLQEADLGSTRCDFVDESIEVVQRLAKKQNQQPYYLETGTCLDFDEKRLERFWRIARSVYGDERSQWILRKLSIDKQKLPKDRIRVHFGNAILSRYPLRERFHHFFIPPYSELLMGLNIIRRKDERKSLLACRVDYHPEIAEKVPLFVYNTHLENNDLRNRRLQSKIMYDALSKQPNAHKILALDGNAEPLGPDYDLESGEKDESLERLLRHPEMCYFPGINPQSNGGSAHHFATSPSQQPARILDTVLVSKYLEIVNYRVHPAAVSDHLAVIADIRINADLVQESLLRRIATNL